MSEGSGKPTRVSGIGVTKIPGARNADAAGSPERHAARAAAVEAQLKLFSEATLRATPNLSIWSRPLFSETGPIAIIRRKAARFRMPRMLKSELLDRFTSQDPAHLASLTSLIIVAHPDDESIGAGGRLGVLGDAWVVSVTDGAPRDPECAHRHGFATREAYAEARRAEVERALQVAGVPLERLINLDIVDGEATLRLAELCLRVTEIIDSIRPQVVVTHPYEGGHTDHDATAFAVHLACGILRREGARPPAILELASYHARNGAKVLQAFLPHEGADREQRVVALTQEERERKRLMFDCFATQSAVLDHFSTHFERFRPAPRYDFTAPPHGGRLNYELYGQPDRGRVWRQHARDALRMLRLRRP